MRRMRSIISGSSSIHRMDLRFVAMDFIYLKFTTSGAVLRIKCPR
jgi:hypothetical protein